MDPQEMYKVNDYEVIRVHNLQKVRGEGEERNR
jgi:hypothetical protein